MKVLVLGASGATGQQVVRQFISRKIHARILIRNSAVLPKEVQESPLVEVVQGNIHELNTAEMNRLLGDCTAVISCLGHNMTLKGMFGNPRYLVSDAIRRICETVKQRPDRTVRLLLMSTTGYTNTLLGETHSMGEKIILSILKLLLPPHRDNVEAANYLIERIGRNDGQIRWVVVRPDTLINDDEVSPYEVCESPTRSPIFHAGTTSRTNVGHFMAELVAKDALWRHWESKTPVIYNK